MSTMEREAARASERRKTRPRLAAREIPPAIRWSEGMLLAPQHFQSLAHRGESLLHFHATALSPYHWGLTQFEFDRELLVNKGLFRVMLLEAVMPDGLIVHWKAGDGPDLEHDLGPESARLAERPRRLYLAVRERGATLSSRYKYVDVKEVADETSNACTVDMSVLKPHISLLFGDEPGGKYVHFPLVELTYRNDAFTTTKYQPPWLRLFPGNRLFDLCATLAAKLREKANYLADQMGSNGSSARGGQLLETRALVHSLVGGLPVLDAILASGNTHPWPLYLSLCSLLGHVAGIGHALVPPPLAPYDHNDPIAAFEQVLLSIQTALSEGIHETFTAHRFVSADDEFRLRFDGEWANRGLVLGLRAPFGSSEADMARWLAKSIVGGRSHIENFRDSRMMGLTRTPADADGDLPPSRGVSLYSLVHDPAKLAPGEELVVVNPDQTARGPQEIVLYVRNRG